MLVLEPLEDREALRPHLFGGLKWPAMPRLAPVRAQRMGAEALATTASASGARRGARTSGCPRWDRSTTHSCSSSLAISNPERDRLAPQRPGEGAAEVVLLGQGDVQPLTAGAELARVQIRASATDEEVLGVPPIHLVGVGSCVEQLDRVLPDRVEHAQAAASPAADEVLDDERLEGVEIGLADCLRRLEREASSEDGEAAEELLLVRRRAARSSTRSSRAVFAASSGASRERDARSGSRSIEPREQLVRDPAAQHVPRRARSRVEARRAVGRSRHGRRRLETLERPPGALDEEELRHRRPAAARPDTAARTRRAAALGS